MGKLNIHFSRLFAILLLLSAISATSLDASTSVLAAGTCNGNITDATTHATDATAANCTVGVAFDMGAGALTIDTNTDANATFTCTPSTVPCVYVPSTNGFVAPFTFTAHVTDSRNLQSTAGAPNTEVGWHLNETYSTLVNNFNASDNIDSITVATTTASCDTAHCNIAAIGQLTSSTFTTGAAQLAFKATTSGTPPQTSSGTYSLVTTGSVAIPSGAPGGSTYTGTITLGLVSVPV